MTSPQPPARPIGPTSSSKALRLRRLGKWSVLFLLGGAIAGELGARFIIGLGDPPLYRLDPQIEYELVPSATYRRFGNTYAVNAHGMRAAEFPSARAAPNELRVMVIGDSIVNAGPRVDDSAVATRTLQAMLQEKLKRPVVVGNISAGSWGPPNQLAWVSKHGLFDADVVLIVTNSGDDADVPGLEGIGSQWPQRKPMLALQELIGTYAWRAVCKAMGRSPEPAPAHVPDPARDREACRTAFTFLVELARSRGAKVGLIQHWKRTEIESQPENAHGVIRSWADAARVPTWQLDAAALGPDAAGKFLPGDGVHYNAAGQAALARVLQQATESLMEPAP